MIKRFFDWPRSLFFRRSPVSGLRASLTSLPLFLFFLFFSLFSFNICWADNASADSDQMQVDLVKNIKLANPNFEVRVLRGPDFDNAPEQSDFLVLKANKSEMLEERPPAGRRLFSLKGLYNVGRGMLGTLFLGYSFSALGSAIGHFKTDRSSIFITGSYTVVLFYITHLIYRGSNEHFFGHTKFYKLVRDRLRPGKNPALALAKQIRQRNSDFLNAISERGSVVVQEEIVSREYIDTLSEILVRDYSFHLIDAE